MQYRRCKCGNYESWSSSVPAPCSVCEKCGSTLALPSGTYYEPEEHIFVKKYDQNTGEPYEICKRCNKRKKKVEEKEIHIISFGLPSYVCSFDSAKKATEFCRKNLPDGRMNFMAGCSKEDIKKELCNLVDLAFQELEK